MADFFKHLEEDWDKLRNKIHDEGQKLDAQVDQTYDYTNTSSPDQIEIESMTATPRAEKAVREAMAEYRKSDEDKSNQ